MASSDSSTESWPYSVNRSDRDQKSTFENSTQNPDNEEINKSPIQHAMLAGGFGGAVGDSIMHSLDTVKTRQQGSAGTLKYRNMIPAYSTIIREEGIRRGLYGGYEAAMLGSFPGTAIFFGTYESLKRLMINEWDLNPTFSYLVSGFVGDFASTIVYVPSEVLKTRLQLQGRHNNPHFTSGYNYKNTTDAIKTIVKTEGWQTLYFGYKATIVRDLPFSALQLAFYEKFRQLAFQYARDTQDSESSSHHPVTLPIYMELLTGSAAGGLAGTLTTPLDVIKTRVQTQKKVSPSSLSSIRSGGTLNNQPIAMSAQSIVNQPSSAISKAPNPSGIKKYTIPSTAQPAYINTSSTIKGLNLIYKTEGIYGLFSGVGPRFVWTSIQSSIMLFLYQYSLTFLDKQFGDGKTSGEAF